MGGANPEKLRSRERTFAVVRIIARTVHDAGADAATCRDRSFGIALMRPSVRDAHSRGALHTAGKVSAPYIAFSAAPAASSWSAAIQRTRGAVRDWDHVSRAVALVADHQSEEATDVRHA